VFSSADNGQTKPKPRDSKKTSKLTTVEQEGESRCLFRACRGNKKISTVVWIIKNCKAFSVIGASELLCKVWIRLSANKSCYPLQRICKAGLKNKGRSRDSDWPKLVFCLAKKMSLVFQKDGTCTWMTSQNCFWMVICWSQWGPYFLPCKDSIIYQGLYVNRLQWHQLYTKNQETIGSCMRLFQECFVTQAELTLIALQLESVLSVIVQRTVISTWLK